MSERDALIRMLHQLLEDMRDIQQQGAGYYSCIPLAKRYNKLLAMARGMLGAGNGLIATFDDIAESDPKDPGDKMKVVQGIRIEIGQLMSLLSTAAKDSETKGC